MRVAVLSIDSIHKKREYLRPKIDRDHHFGSMNMDEFRVQINRSHVRCRLAKFITHYLLP